MQTKGGSFERLITIMNELREQCPWDKKQTIDTLRSMTIEEMYELVDAITENNWKGIKEELGDLLLHIVFYTRIATEKNEFSIDEMINNICEKLIARHPHIYKDVKVNDAEEVKRNWEKLKVKEGKTSVLSGVPVSLPALVKAQRIQEKVKQVGFEWENIEDVWKKVEEEISELHNEIEIKNQLGIEEEFGDLMFSMINYARFLNIDAESALEKTNKKFIRRFQKMEDVANRGGKNLWDMTLVEMDELWNSIKHQS